jgi:hypothetical protein
MNKAIKYFLIINGIILLSYAIVLLTKPATLGEMVGFTQHSPNTLVEVMAFYGGLELGLALFFIWSAFNTNRFKPALTAFILIFLCAGTVRLIGLIQHGFEGSSQPVVSVIEISFSLFAIWLTKKITIQASKN